MSRPEPSRIPSSVRIRRYNAGGTSSALSSDTGVEATSPKEQGKEIQIPPRDSSRRKHARGTQHASPRRRGAIENLVYNDRKEQQRAQRWARHLHRAKPGLPHDRRAAESSSGAGPRNFQRATAPGGAAMPALEEVVSPTSPGGTMTERVPLSEQRHKSTLDKDAQAQSRQQDGATGSSGEVQGQSSYGRIDEDPIHVPRHLHGQYPTADQDPYDQDHHADQVADYLDVVDSEVGTLSYLSNIQNSIFAPPIPMLYDRRPSHSIPALRQRSGTVTSRRGSLRQRRGSKASLGSRHDEGRRGSAAAGGAGDLELGPLGSGLQDGTVPTRTASRGMLSRMSSRVSTVITGRKQADEEKEYDKHIEEWRYMDDEERNELDEHVKLVLKKGSKFRRGLKGFWAFVKTPMGFIMTLYGFLITFWGTAIMFFIFGWIHAEARQRYWIEICDQILCALFAAVGLGFAPFRAVDTYRMIHIARLHHKTWRRRQEMGLSDLRDPNDLPRPEEDGKNQVKRASTDDLPKTRNPFKKMISPLHSEDDSLQRKQHFWSHKDETPSQADESLLGETSTPGTDDHSKIERSFKRTFSPPIKTSELVVPSETIRKYKGSDVEPGKPQPALKRNESIQSELVKEHEDIVVLTPEEQDLLEFHQRKFHNSHTFYRFHETATHRAFPLDLMITIVCLLDCHSLLQGALGGCTWGIKYTHRPTALTASLITCSLSCNAMAGLLIYIGGRRTKKREEVERRLRVALEQMALDKIERRRARGELPERAGGSEHTDNMSDADRVTHFRSSDGLRMGLADIKEHVNTPQEDDAKETSHKSGEHEGPSGSSNDSSGSVRHANHSLEEQSEDDAHEFRDAVDAAATYTDRQEYRYAHPR